MLALALVNLPPSFSVIAAPAWAGLAYVSLFSMLIGFFFWYRGLAQGGIAGVGQLQLRPASSACSWRQRCCVSRSAPSCSSSPSPSSAVLPAPRSSLVRALQVRMDLHFAA